MTGWSFAITPTFAVPILVAVIVAWPERTRPVAARTVSH